MSFNTIKKDSQIEARVQERQEDNTWKVSYKTKIDPKFDKVKFGRSVGALIFESGIEIQHNDEVLGKLTDIQSMFRS